MAKMLSQTRGETMIEVLVALVIVIVGAIAALKLLALSIINIQLSAERVVATNLAQEGIEAVRSIRDTNWLRFAGERRTCWNNGNLAGCTDSSQIASGSYILIQNAATKRWQLATPADPKGDPLKKTATGEYSNIGTGLPAYYRKITIEYLNDTATAVTNNSADNVMRVTSTVGWESRGRPHDVVLTTNLTDYLGRNNHD